MKVYSLYIRYLVRRYGGWNLLLLFILLLILLTVMLLNLPVRQQLKAESEQSATMKQALLQRQSAQISDAPHAMMHAFYSMLPKQAAITTQLEAFFDAAFENQIYLDAIDYKLDEATDRGFTRYHILLPVSGSYTNIRKFVKQVLEALPSAALEGISLEREDAGDSEVDAKLHFILFVRGD